MMKLRTLAVGCVVAGPWLVLAQTQKVVMPPSLEELDAANQGILAKEPFTAFGMNRVMRDYLPLHLQTAKKLGLEVVVASSGNASWQFRADRFVPGRIAIHARPDFKEPKTYTVSDYSEHPKEFEKLFQSEELKKVLVKNMGTRWDGKFGEWTLHIRPVLSPERMCRGCHKEAQVGKPLADVYYFTRKVAKK